MKRILVAAMAVCLFGALLLPTASAQEESTPRGELIEVRDDLASLVGTASNRTDRKLDRAVRFLDSAIEVENWIDEIDPDPVGGRKVFRKVENAVKELRRIDDIDVSSSISTLTGFAQFLATYAVVRAAEAGVTDLDKAIQQMDNAIVDVVNGKPHKAINHYKRAWKKALQALEDFENRQVNLQILAINDFHGNIATSSSSFGGTGRADFLAANIAAAEAEADNSIFVSAGDLIGASPLISALFHDEPTIEAMNLMGLDINGVGNHEFDEGPAELLRMANGGTHPVDGDLDGDGFAGADFEFLAANVIDDATGSTFFAPYTIKEYDGVGVAFIGMTLEGTPSIVTPSGVAGLTFNDEVATVNALIPELREQDVESIVVLLHEGGFSDGGQNDCGTGLTGPIAEITAQLDDAVDLVIAGHTNDEFICEIDGKWVTMADNRGRLFTDIDVTLDKLTRDMTIVTINNVANLQDGVTPDPTLTELIDKYDALSAPLANQVIGSTTADILRSNNDSGESALGDVIADVQLDATDDPEFGDAVVDFMNPGGIRNDILVADTPGGEAPGEVTYGEAFGVQPFGNSLVTMSLSGAEIDALLEQQFDNPEVGSNRILQVSAGFEYEWSESAPVGSKVDIASIMIDGVPIVAGDTYRVTVNSFLADGGDNFPILVGGTDRLGGEVDLDALVTYFGANSPIAPGPQDRITRIE